MNKLYRVREFAELAGVTVRALHHYDRLGLLKPGRTAAGYRCYSLRDFERLEQIVALKFLGIPLKQIRTLFNREAPPCPKPCACSAGYSRRNGGSWTAPSTPSAKLNERRDPANGLILRF